MAARHFTHLVSDDWWDEEPDASELFMPIQNGKHFKVDPFKLFVPTVPESPFMVPVEKNEAADAVARLHVDEIVRELESQLKAETARREEERRATLVVEAMPVAARPEVGGAVDKPDPARMAAPSLPLEPAPGPAQVAATESARVAAPTLPLEPDPEPDQVVDDAGEEVFSDSDKDALGATLKLERIVVAPKIEASDTQPAASAATSTAKSVTPAAEKTSEVDTKEYLVTAVPKERLEVSTDYVQDLNDIAPSQELSLERQERKKRPFWFFASIGAWVSRLLHLDDE